ncbi:MAG: hypothetical protein U0Q19_21380 [Kineosporiaceae bacterium]
MTALSGPPAALDRVLTEAVTAVHADDEAADERLADALGRLDRADPHHLHRLLTATVRPALEARHPDGVTGDDLEILLREVGHADPTALAVVLTGAFGVVVEAGEVPELQLAPSEITRAAVVLLAHLVPTARDLRRVLDAAWSEIARADHQD